MSFSSAPKTVGSGVREAATRALSREGGPASRSGVAARLLAWALSGGVASKAAVLVTTFGAARSLAPRQFGEYAGLCATTQLAAGIWDMGVASLLTYEYASSSMSVREALGRCVRLRASTLVLWLGAFAFGAAVVARDGDVPTSAMLYFAAASLCAGSGTLASAMLNARLRFRESSAATAIGRWVTAAVSLAGLPAIALIRGPVAFAAAVLAGEAATMGASWLAAALLLKRAAGPDQRRAETGAPGAAVGKGAAGLDLRRALPYAANGILAVLYNRFDVVILAGLSSVSQLASYAPASRIQDALYLLPNALGTVAFPLVAAERLGTRASGRLMTRFSLLGLVLAIPATAACFVLMPAIVSLVLGPGYAGVATPARILIWFLPLSAVSAPMVAALAGSNRAVDTTKIFAVAAGVALALHLALDHWLGAVGGAIASLAREPAVLALSWMLARRAGLLGQPAGFASGQAYGS